MIAEQKEVFRKAVLQVLDANRTRFGLSLPALRFNVSIYGFRQPTDEDLIEATDYLTAKGFVEEVRKLISTEVRTWRITHAGMAFIDSGA